MPRQSMRAVHRETLLLELSLGTILASLPKDSVDEALRQTETGSLRYRLLPATITAYLVIMLAMHAEASVRENLRILLEALRKKLGLDAVPVPTGAAITKARRRLGTAPFAYLFDTIAKPVGKKSTPGCFWKRFRMVAADATTVDTQDTAANRLRFGIHSNQYGQVGYPHIKIAVLVECGTRVPFGFVWGSGDTHETVLFDPLRIKLAKDMLFLADRAFYSFERWQDCAVRAGALLWRVRNNLKPTPLRELPDGSWLAEIHPSNKLLRKGLSQPEEKAVVRVIEYQPRFADGTEGEQVRLFTTLLEPTEASAEELARLYHERWEVETGFDELKTHLRGADRVLRSPVPDLVEQELYGFFLAYHAVRVTMAEAARRERCSPHELSFIHAVRVIRRRISFPPAE